MRFKRSGLLDFVVIIGLLAAMIFLSFAMTRFMLRLAADHNYEHEGEGRLPP